MNSYEKLKAWQACHRLVLTVYRTTEGWPAEERYGLVSQARRAAFSAAANIAEGSAKRGPREFRRYLDTTLGSLAELRYVLRLAGELGLVDSEAALKLGAECDEAGKISWGLYDYIRRKT